MLTKNRQPSGRCFLSFSMLKRIRQFRAIQARRLSTAGSPYDNYAKLRAIPFNVSPEKAQRLLAFWAAVTCDRRKLSSSSWAYLLPFLNLDFLRPARFAAVYFPAWFVTGEVEARITYKGVQLTERAWFDNAYIPGSHLAVLSAAPLNIPFVTKMETVPFTTPLLHQHGEPVQCIPFSTSPFSVLDIAASHHPSSIAINEDLSIDPSSVKPNLLSASPVLLPLYLAQYEIEGDSANNMFTFILRAHDSSPMAALEAIQCENLSKVGIEAKNIIRLYNEFSNFTGFELDSSSEVTSFFPETPRVSMTEVSMPQRKVITKSMTEWLDELLSSSKNIEILAESSLDVIGKGDEDLRMREMTSEERESLERYTEITEIIMIIKRHLTKLLVFEQHTADRTLLNNIGFSEQKKRYEEKIKSLEAERAQVAPEWWSEWLALNRSESENTNT